MGDSLTHFKPQLLLPLLVLFLIISILLPKAIYYYPVDGIKLGFSAPMVDVRAWLEGGCINVVIRNLGDQPILVKYVKVAGRIHEINTYVCANTTVSYRFRSDGPSVIVVELSINGKVYRRYAAPAINNFGARDTHRR